MFSRATKCGRGTSAYDLPDRDVLPAKGSDGCARWLGWGAVEAVRADKRTCENVR